MTEEDRLWWSNIISRVRGGDTFAYVEFCEKITPKLMAICIAYLRNTKDSEDAVQDVFVLIIRKSSELRRNDNPFGWMYQIARNRCLDIIREKKKKPDLEISCDDVSMFEFESGEDRITLMDLLNKLKQDERELIVLRYWGNLTFSTIGKIIRKSKSAVERNIKKILDKLREEMQDE